MVSKIYKLTLLLLLITMLFFIGVSGYYGYVNVNRRVTYDKLAGEVAACIADFPGEAGVYIKDLRTGAEIKFNEKKLFPSASLVKLPIMATVFIAADDGILSLDELLTLRRKYKAGGSGQLKRNRSGGNYSIEKLIEIMITESDNTATNMLTDRLGLEYINRSFRERLGLESTNLDRYIMDLRARRRGIENYTTAEEMGRLLEKIYKGQVSNEKASFKMLNILLMQKIRDRIPRLLPKGLPVAHKTGLMRNTCHDAGIIFTAKGDFVVCVLTSEPTSKKRAKILIGDIAYKAYQYY